MTPKYSFSPETISDASALDLIRQLDQSLAKVNQGIVEASCEAESATQNAHLAAEIRRRFSKPGAVVSSQPSLSPPKQHSSYEKTPKPPSPPKQNTRFAEAHAEELVDLSSHLEHVKHQLEQEMMDHQDTKAKCSVAESAIDKLTRQVASLEQQLESVSVSHEHELAESHTALQAAQDAVQVEREDAEYAMELAKQKIAEEQEMRILLQQVLEKNEEYRQFIAEHNSNKKVVSFSDPIDDLSQQNHRMLVTKGRELLHRQQANDASPSKQVTHAISTCQATAAILKQSGCAIGCWEDAEVSISDEVQLERLAKSYVHAVELQMNQQRQSIQELESFCALLEQSER